MSDNEAANHHDRLFLDMLRTLQKAEDNESALHAVMDAVAGMFLPARVCFVPEERSGFTAMGDSGPWTAEARLLPDQMIKLLPSKKGFAVALKNRGRRIGLLIVDGVREPRDLDQAVPFILALPDALELSLSNIRYMQELNESRDQFSRLSESLGVANKILRHDIANEMLVISSSLDLYRQNNRERDLLRAQGSLLRMHSIITQMRDLDSFLLARREMTATSLTQVINATLPALEMPYTVQGDAQILADPALKAVIENLVRNAKKHGQAKGMEFVIIKKDGKVVLAVRDDGKGLPVDQLDRIFQEGVAFGESKGTGLGLYLVKRTMVRYGGSIRADNDPRGGARFELTFRSVEP
ncbi:MAG: HAMP domain-containing sensor histidine kinase [Methanomassiliicoccales archaeon]|nr:HAMP domain-containing sensor histidine kinase [Methanomassiliicoccales archaeon]